MATNVNIAEAKTRLSELVSAAVRGEEIVLARSGSPQVRLVAVQEAVDADRARRATRRLANIGYARDAAAGLDLTVPDSMTEAEVEARERRLCASGD